MYTGNQLLIVIEMDCDSAVLQLTSVLESAGYLVVQSFDLHSAMTANGGCNCIPASCSCQIVVLLVYSQDGPPVTLILDSNKLQTSIYIVNGPSHSVHPGWVGKLAQLLPNDISSFTPMPTLVE